MGTAGEQERKCAGLLICKVSRATRRHRRVAPFNHSRGQMASDFHGFLVKHTEERAHPHQVSKSAAPKRARRAASLRSCLH
jgi:hypothetical protein